MKKISILAFLFAGMLSFSSCESDRDSNPVLQEPTEFVLNVPAYVNTTYDLANSTSIELTCSQPDFGFTAPAVYAVQVALDQSFENYIQFSYQTDVCLGLQWEISFCLSKSNIQVSQSYCQFASIHIHLGC